MARVPAEQPVVPAEEHQSPRLAYDDVRTMARICLAVPVAIVAWHRGSVGLCAATCMIMWAPVKVLVQKAYQLNAFSAGQQKAN